MSHPGPRPAPSVTPHCHKPFVYAENGLTKMPNAVAMPRFLQQCHVVRHEMTL